MKENIEKGTSNQYKTREGCQQPKGDTEHTVNEIDTQS